MRMADAGADQQPRSRLPLSRAAHAAERCGAGRGARKFPGVYLLREYQRFYPAGEVTGHLLGFTKKYEDIGQEGLELAYDRWLGAEAGAKRVIQDRYGRTVEDVESIRAPRPGSDLITSIDLRIQYLAYRELKAAVQEHDAKAGSSSCSTSRPAKCSRWSISQPYNPNDRDQVAPSRYRNRAATDIFEPGSSIKPFIAAAGIGSGRYHAEHRDRYLAACASASR